MARTRAGATCPCCGTPESTINVAQQMLRFNDSTDQIIAPNYAVCEDCHAKQMHEFYNEGKTWTLAVIPREEV